MSECICIYDVTEIHKMSTQYLLSTVYESSIIYAGTMSICSFLCFKTKIVVFLRRMIDFYTPDSK